MVFKRYILIGIGLTMIACSKTPPTVTRDNLVPSSELRHEEYLRDSQRFARGVERSNFDVLSYSLKGRFDWRLTRLFASVEIQLKLLDGTRVELDSHVSKIASVSVIGGALLPHAYDPSTGKLVVEVGEGKRELGLVIKYEVQANSAAVRARSSALQAVLPRSGDPVSSRVVSTFSEPVGASYWIPCHDVPADRAHFSAEFLMPAGERLISNGDLVVDKVTEGERHMKYSTRYTLPTYLMAFSQGEFETATRHHGNLPVSLWVRRGVSVDYEGMLESITGFISTFERLMGPYPFEKYATVLLPEFMGGIEHAGITFQGEVSSTQSQLSTDLGLTAHELGHQWFGDFVTVATWDDLWIKEGMATLLAEEATRYFEDSQRSGRLFGSNFYVAAGDAIRDPSLQPDDKYTSGPYGRAGWLLTQIRNRVGEERFWATIRRLLTDHGFGSIGTEQFLEYFRPYLGEDVFHAVMRALSAKALPEIRVTRGMLTLSDPDGALVNPIDYRWYELSGGYSQGILGEAPVALEGKRLLAIDVFDQHPLPSFQISSEAYAGLLGLLVPSGEEAMNQFILLPPHQQDLAIDPRASWRLTPHQFELLYRSLASDEVKYEALQLACTIAKEPHQLAEWKAVLEPSFLNPPYRGLPARSVDAGFSGCERLIDIFVPRLQRLRYHPKDPHFDEAELVLLSSFPADPVLAFSAWSRVVEEGRSVRARSIGLVAISRYLQKLGTFGFPEALAQWKGFVHRILELYEPSEMQFVGLQIVKSIGDKDSLGSIAKVARRAYHPRVQHQAVCTAYSISGSDTDAWNRFVKDLGDLSQLPELVQSLVADPKACGG